jgi:hypothetical protein
LVDRDPPRIGRIERGLSSRHHRRHEFFDLFIPEQIDEENLSGMQALVGHHDRRASPSIEWPAYAEPFSWGSIAISAVRRNFSIAFAPASRLSGAPRTGPDIATFFGCGSW